MEKKKKPRSKLNAGEKAAKAAGFKIGTRSPALGTKARAAKDVAASYMKKSKYGSSYD